MFASHLFGGTMPGGLGIEMPSLRSQPLAWIGLATAVALVLGGFLVFRGCGSSSRTRARPEASGVEVRALDLSGIRGLSGLSSDAEGSLWAVPEEGKALVRIEETSAEAAITLVGMPTELELEALAWIEGLRFAIGTETSDRAEPIHRIYLMDGTSGRAKLDRSLTLDARELGVQPVANEGIEGLCHADGLLLAALETPVRMDGRRYAALAHRRIPGATDEGEWKAHRVRLTSTSGKISALDCRLRDETLVVHAVERHYQVMRLLRFDLPLRASRGETTRATLIRDLRRDIVGTPNFEGLVVRQGVAWVLVDNHYGRRTGPNEIVRIELSTDR